MRIDKTVRVGPKPKKEMVADLRKRRADSGLVRLSDVWVSKTCRAALQAEGLAVIKAASVLEAWAVLATKKDQK